MVSNFFDTHRGGLDIVAGRLARELAARGFEVSWLATDACEPPDDACRVRAVGVSAWNIAERRLGVPFPLLSPAAIGRLFAEVRGADAVLLHDSLYVTSMATFVATRRAKKPLVILQHIGAVPYRSPVLRGLMALANRCVGAPLLSGAEQVVFISQFVRDYFGKLTFKAPPRLIFNGVDAAIFHPPGEGEKAAARARLGLPADGTVALFVGRFVEKKGVHLLRLAAQRRGDITWAFAGWGVLDPARWGLANVRVFSDLSGASLAELYRASDVFVLPSVGEGFPLVIQEALACGLPVVCGAESVDADPSAAPLLLGVDVAGGGADDAAARILEALDGALAGDGPMLAAQRSAFVRERYAWSAAADRYAEILTGLIGQPQAVDAA
jgi:glycosyltransferase involved in cell wall biosynthesis